MPHLIQIVTATCPPDVAAERFFDWSRDATWRHSVRRMTVHPSGPAVVGQRIVEELRLAGLTFITPTQVESVHPCRVTWSGGNDRLAIRGHREIELTGSGDTRLTEVVGVELLGALRHLTPLLTPMYRRTMRTELAELGRQLDGLPAKA